MNKNSNKSGMTIGNIGTIMGAIFVILKLTNVITWPWLWVLSPIWIPTCLAAGLLTLVLGRKIVKNIQSRVSEKRELKTEEQRNKTNSQVKKETNINNITHTRTVELKNKSEKKADKVSYPDYINEYVDNLEKAGETPELKKTLTKDK